MLDKPFFSQVPGKGGDPRLDILFVHGLTGDPFDTWVAGQANEYWPAWLYSDLRDVSVYALGYSAGIFAKWAKKEMNLHERAGNMLEHLASYNIGSRPIVFVCHSLGGLLAKEMLRASNESLDDGWRSISRQTRLMVFMATPHTGASLASAIKLIAPRLSSTYVDLLSNDGGYLTSLNQSYRDFAKSSGVATMAYYEKFKTANAALIVSAESADPGVGDTRPVAVDADHLGICKPAKPSDLVYTSLCRHLRAVLKSCPAAVPPSVGSVDLFEADDYSAATAEDRRDLLQKLIDAGREHEYQKANDLQNKFAQRYYRLGLHAEAKKKNDAVLSLVEQRFTTHVYSAKICKGASDDEIAAALQLHVIDPICLASGEEKLSPTAVLQALYFLTEQCYIRWDPA